MSPKDGLPHLASKDLHPGEKDGIRRRNNNNINERKINGLEEVRGYFGSAQSLFSLISSIKASTASSSGTFFRTTTFSLYR